MGEIYGRTVQNSFYAYGIIAIEMVGDKESFTTREFHKKFNSARKLRNAEWSPDRNNSAANDTLRSFAHETVKVIENVKRGVYRFLKSSKRQAQVFNKIFPYVEKGLIHKEPVVRKIREKKPIASSIGLTKLGSANTKYDYDRPSVDILETFTNKHPDQLYLVSFTQERDEFSSLCPITGQPDFARMEIIYVPNEKMVESKSLKLYFFSFRNSGEFHEDVCNRMMKDLWNKLDPTYLRVFGDFAPRGGIAIKPLIERWQKDLKDIIMRDIILMVNSWDRKK